MATASAAANAALLEAARKGLLHDAKRALKTGANVSCRDSDGWTSTARRGDVEIVDVVVRHKDSDEHRLLGSQRLDQFLGVALFVAATHGQLEVARMLLVYGADQDLQDEGGIMPMMQASKRGHVGIVDLLLAWNAKVHAQTQTQSTALHLAARNGGLDVSNLLLQNGADARARTASSKTMLHLATESGVLDMVKLMLEQVQCVNEADENGFTALLVASSDGNVPLFELLMATPTLIAVRVTAARRCILPRERGDWMRAIGDKVENTADLFLTNKAEISKVAKDGKTALHWAATSGLVRIADRLADSADDIDVVDQQRWTPLMAAAAAG